MARLYIRHEPTTILVTVGGYSPFSDEGTQYFYVDAAEVSDINFIYVCFVHKGQCWAARSKNFFQSGKKASFGCVPFNNDPSGKLMLLKDALLG